MNSEGKVIWATGFGPTILNVLVNSNNEYIVLLGETIVANTTIDGEKMADGQTIITENAVNMIKFNSDGKIMQLYDGTVESKNIMNETIDSGIIYLSSSSIKKYNSNYELEWNNSLSLNGVVFNNVIETSDNKYIAIGYFTKDITITSDYTSNSEEIILMNSGGNDGIIIKYSEDGLIEWVKALGAETEDNLADIIEKNTNEYVVVANVGKRIVTTIEGTEKEIFGAVKITYNENGESLKLENERQSSQIYNSITGTLDGGSVAVGSFKGKLEIPAEETVNGNKIELYSNGDADALIVKYNAEGKIEWTNSIGGPYSDEYNDIKIVEGDYVVSGYLGSTRGGIITIPSQETENAEEIELNGKGGSDCLVVEYAQDGLIKSAKSLGGTSNEYIRTMAQTYDGGYLVAGDFLGTITLPSEETVDGNAITLTSLGGRDGIIIKYNTNGFIEWANSIGGTLHEDIYTIDEDNGNILISLYSRGTVNIVTENNETIEITCPTAGDDILINLNEYGEIRWAFKVIVDYPSVRVTGVSIKDDKCLITGPALRGLVSVEGSNTVSGEDITTVDRTGWKGWVLKVNEQGKAEKFLEINTGNGGYRIETGIFDINHTEDGGYAICGRTGASQLTIEAEKVANGVAQTFEGVNLSFIYKYNQNDLIEWAKASNADAAYNSISEGEDGEYFAAGYINKNSVNTGLITKISETTLAAEVPSVQKISAKNEKIKYTIKGTVEGEGGTITIGANKTTETVKYNENSIEDIVITPETGYQIKSIKINEQNYEFEPEEDGTVTLAKFENVLQNKNIVVTFLKTSLASDVVVHHYLWENGSVTTTPVIADELITGETGEQYTALPKLNLAKYELITNSDYYGENIPEGLLAQDYYIPENSVGTIDEGIEVTYYYKLKTYTLTIHHYLDGTKTSLVPDTVKNNIEMDTNYITNIEKTLDLKYQLTTKINGTEDTEGLEIDAQRYKILSIEGNEEGTITENTEITYYYTDTAFNLTVEKVWEDNENIGNTRPEQITIQLIKNEAEFQKYVLDIVNGESSYTFTELYKYDENEKEIIYTAQEASVPDGYYVSSTTKKNNKITITNSKLGSITINKVDKKTSEPLQGAKFKIEKQQGGDLLEIQTITTDENGQAKIEELQYGIYKITETKAPEGYNLNKKSQEIEISSSNIDSEITITNREKTILPEAGGAGAYLITVIGIITIIGGIIIKNNKRKQKNKN